MYLLLLPYQSQQFNLRGIEQGQVKFIGFWNYVVTPKDLKIPIRVDSFLGPVNLIFRHLSKKDAIQHLTKNFLPNFTDIDGLQEYLRVLPFGGKIIKLIYEINERWTLGISSCLMIRSENSILLTIFNPGKLINILGCR